MPNVLLTNYRSYSSWEIVNQYDYSIIRHYAEVVLTSTKNVIKETVKFTSAHCR